MHRKRYSASWGVTLFCSDLYQLVVKGRVQRISLYFGSKQDWTSITSITNFDNSMITFY
jgi:fatty acid-binding protein DegV